MPAKKPAPRANRVPESLLGLSRAEVRRRFGRPSRRGDDFDSFFRAGLVVDYDADGTTTKVSTAWFVSGDVFDERVLGVALGESRADCVALWGEPVKVRKNSGLKHRTEWYHHAGYLIEVEVWKCDGHEDVYGDFRAETVQEIAVSKAPPRRP